MLDNFIDILKKEGYLFHSSIDDNKDKPLNLKYKINTLNIKELVSKIRKQISQILKKEKIDVIYPIRMKGESIFQSIIGYFNKQTPGFFDSYESGKKMMEEKNILIFDDCIKTGETIEKTIAFILKFNPKKIVIYSIVNRSDSLSVLVKKYSADKKLIFYCWEYAVVPLEIFTNSYRMIIWPLFEYLGLPLIDTPYLVGEIKTKEKLLELYKSIVIDKKSAASIINPAVVDESLVIKGSINYTKFFNNKYQPYGINHSKIFMRFFFLEKSPSSIVFLLYPDVSYSDLSIKDNLCQKSKIFPLCLKTKYDKDKSCPDCVRFNLLKDITDNLLDICSNKLKIKILEHNDEFLLRYYPKMVPKSKT